MSNDKNAFFYFAEQTSPDPRDINFQFDVVKGAGGTWWVEFDACLHLFEFMNRNTRQYLGDNIMDCLNTEKILAMLKNNAWYGEENHPYPEIEGQKLSEKRIRSIEMSKRSHKIMAPRREGNGLYAHIQTASGTDVGRGFANEIIQGLIPTFSCRCFGVMRLIDKKPTIMVKLIVTYDWVLYPGFADAKMLTTPKVSTASLPVTESAETSFSCMDCAIPFTELAIDLSEKDSEVVAYMEAFDLDASSLVGVTPDMKSAIISPDRDHYIYANMSKASVDKVRDFYRSFK